MRTPAACRRVFDVRSGVKRKEPLRDTLKSFPHTGSEELVTRVVGSIPATSYMYSVPTARYSMTCTVCAMFLTKQLFCDTYSVVFQEARLLCKRYACVKFNVL